MRGGITPGENVNIDFFDGKAGMMKTREKVIPECDDESFSHQRPQSHPVQLGLFEHNDMTFFNRGIQALNNLDLEKAVGLFQKHRRLYPKGCDATSRLKAAEFLLKRLSQAPAQHAERPGYLCRLWDSFEEYGKSVAMDYDVAKLKRKYFSRVLEEVEQA